MNLKIQTLNEIVDKYNSIFLTASIVVIFMVLCIIIGASSVVGNSFAVILFVLNIIDLWEEVNEKEQSL